jgi:hypothetical protein
MSGPLIGLAVHLENKAAVVEIAGWNFTGLARVNGQYLACGPEGLFVLGEAADDAGEPIAALVELPETDFGSSRPKRITEAIVSGRLPAGGELAVTVRGENGGRGYRLRAGSDGPAARRCPFGREDRGVRLAVAVANVDGEPFTLDGIELAVQRLTRGR